MTARARARRPVGVRGWAGGCALALTAATVTLLALDLVAGPWLGGTASLRARPNQDSRFTTTEFSVRVQTNRLGFREPRLPGPKPPGTTRILTLGDSFTWGHGVEEADSWPRRLETLLAAGSERRVEVINLAIAGTNPLDYLSVLREVGLAYEPDLVVVGFMANDVLGVWLAESYDARSFNTLINEARQTVAPRPLWRRLPTLLLPRLYPWAWTRVYRWRQARRAPAPEPSAAAGDDADDATPGSPRRSPAVPPERWRDVLALIGARLDRQDEIERAVEARDPATQARLREFLIGSLPFGTMEGRDAYYEFVALIAPDVRLDAMLVPPYMASAWTATAAALGEIARLARARGAEVAWVFVPDDAQIVPATREMWARYGYRWDPRVLEDTSLADRLRAVGAAHDVPVIDLTPALRAVRDTPLYFPIDGHWTPRGHAIAARTLAPALRDLLARHADGSGTGSLAPAAPARSPGGH